MSPQLRVKQSQNGKNKSWERPQNQKKQFWGRPQNSILISEEVLRNLFWFLRTSSELYFRFLRMSSELYFLFLRTSSELYFWFLRTSSEWSEDGYHNLVFYNKTCFFFSFKACSIFYVNIRLSTNSPTYHLLFTNSPNTSHLPLTAPITRPWPLLNSYILLTCCLFFAYFRPIVHLPFKE